MLPAMAPDRRAIVVGEPSRLGRNAECSVDLGLAVDAAKSTAASILVKIRGSKDPVKRTEAGSATDPGAVVRGWRCDGVRPP